MNEKYSHGARLVEQMGLVTKGDVYDLSSGWWRHMPAFKDYPQFEVVTYNSPLGERVEGRYPFSASDDNAAQFGYISEYVAGSLHTGTHIDALAHVTCGEHDEWFGGVSATDSVGNFGPLKGDASQLPALMGRGVLLDIPALLGVPHLPANFEIEVEHVRGAADRAGVEIRPGDTVLVRTGQMHFWPDMEAIQANAIGSGVGLEAAHWLVEQGARYVGADTLSFEVRPSRVPGNPLPVHVYLLQQQGIHILEWVDCEAIAADGVTEFLFVALPLTIRGGTGSPIRPLAVV